MEKFLEKLNRSQLIATIVQLGNKSVENKYVIEKNIAAATGGKNHEEYLKCIEASLENEISAAQERTHKYFDEASPTADVIASYFSNFSTNYSSFGYLFQLRLLCMLADKLGSFSCDGDKIYDFDGEILLNDMDMEVCALLENEFIEKNIALLNNVTEYYENANWKRYQDYGLFEDIDLKGSRKANVLIRALEVEAENRGTTSARSNKRFKLL